MNVPPMAPPSPLAPSDHCEGKDSYSRCSRKGAEPIERSRRSEPHESENPLPETTQNEIERIPCRVGEPPPPGGHLKLSGITKKETWSAALPVDDQTSAGYNERDAESENTLRFDRVIHSTDNLPVMVQRKEAGSTIQPSWWGKALMIVPTYQESENIARLVREIRALSGNIHVLVIDDGSPDGTGDIVEELARADSGISLLRRPRKLGLGTAYRAGFHFGLEKGFSYICTMDADFSHPPEALPSLLERAVSGPDLVVGSRYVQGGSVVGSSAPRRLISYAANRLARTLLGVTIQDCTAGYRCYRRRVLETLDLDAIFSSGYSFLIEMAFFCERAGFSVAEVPITFVNRSEGVSKISRREIYKAFYTLLRLRTQRLPWEWAEREIRRHLAAFRKPR